MVHCGTERPTLLQSLIVTADDFGLSPEINRGIVEAHRNGIVTATSLLMNAPATGEAVRLAATVPDLEIGIHLSLVEGLALSGVESTVSDSLRYFDDRLCLIRHWKFFLRKRLRGGIRLADLRRELDLQIQAFKTHFPVIPFANGTQHMHLLPGIQEMVLQLCVDHGIRRLRIPWQRTFEPMRLSRRVPAEVMLLLGKRMKRKAEPLGIETTDRFVGFNFSGSMTPADLTGILTNLPPGVTELMVHPGFDCPSLRRNLPWGYRDFQWERELEAVTSPTVTQLVETRGIQLSTFSHRRPPGHQPSPSGPLHLPGSRQARLP